MKKVGIITLNGYLNYGNRLQNYALQETLKNLGCEVQTIVVGSDTRNNNLGSKISKLKEKSIKDIYSKVHDLIITRIKSNQIKFATNERIKVFKSFTNQFINESNYKITESKKESKLEDFDYFIIGSDQVWNPYSIEHSPSTYFLQFADDKKRLSYAASFGISNIPDRYTENYSKWLRGMRTLSVRENTGAHLVKKLINRNAEVHVDPTLLLSKNEWLSISESANNRPKNPYLLTYFLGGIPKEHKGNIYAIAKENNLEVINLADINDIETYKTGPAEFIDYINNCRIFCTDSFHGAVFSILLEKPFIIYDRKGVVSMYSRIDTLLEKFNLISRKKENLDFNSDIFNVDYSHIEAILHEEKRKSYEYLNDTLNNEDMN